MKSRLYALALAGAFLALAPVAASAKDATLMLAGPGTQIGRLDEKGRLQWQPARPGMAVRAGDVVKAGRNGAALSRGEDQVVDIPEGTTVIAGNAETLKLGEQRAFIFGGSDGWGGFFGGAGGFGGGGGGGLGLGGLGLGLGAVAIPVAIAASNDVIGDTGNTEASPR